MTQVTHDRVATNQERAIAHDAFIHGVIYRAIKKVAEGFLLSIGAYAGWWTIGMLIINTHGPIFSFNNIFGPAQ